MCLIEKTHVLPGLHWAVKSFLLIQLFIFSVLCIKVSLDLHIFSVAVSFVFLSKYMCFFKFFGRTE